MGKWKRVFLVVAVKQDLYRQTDLHGFGADQAHVYRVSHGQNFL